MAHAPDADTPPPQPGDPAEPEDPADHADPAELVLAADADGVRTLTLNRPEARNALHTPLMAALAGALLTADAADDVAVVVLTGADPAFCAGLDLRELAGGGANLRGSGGDSELNPWRALARVEKPVIGAVNGPAVTGGLELAIGCDFLVASERARFADTHARVGVLPGGGTTGLLPQAVGLRRAKEMSFTGDHVGAQEALRLGLVNHVVPHDELLPTVQRLAATVAANDQRAVRRLKRNYDAGARTTLGECLELEQREFRAWEVDFAEVGRRRASVVDRGRSQAHPR